MLLHSLYAMYLHKDNHGCINRDKWQGRVQAYSELYIKGNQLLSLQAEPLDLKVSLYAPSVCTSCLTIVDRAPVLYGKVYPYCPNCTLYYSDLDRTCIRISGVEFRALLMFAFVKFYNMYELELIISQVIAQGLHQYDNKNHTIWENI